jgi:hypothetical protein
VLLATTSGRNGTAGPRASAARTAISCASWSAAGRDQANFTKNWSPRGLAARVPLRVLFAGQAGDRERISAQLWRHDPQGLAESHGRALCQPRYLWGLGHVPTVEHPPADAPVRPARARTPLSAYHPRPSGSARRVAATARRVAGRARQPTGAGAVFPPVKAAPQSPGRAFLAITESRDLTPHAETGVDAAGPGRQASRTCPRHRDPATGEAGSRPAPSVTARGPRRPAHPGHRRTTRPWAISGTSA